MDYRYVFALVIAFVFFMALIVYVCTALKGVYEENHRKQIQYEIYSDPNLVKMDYDMAYFDEETQAKLLSRVAEGETQVSIDDVMNSRTLAADSAFTPFAKIEADEIEEITGNYKP